MNNPLYAILITMILGSSLLMYAKDISSISSKSKKSLLEWSDFQEKGKNLNSQVMQNIKEQFDAYMGEYNGSKALLDLLNQKISNLTQKKNALKKTDVLQKAKISGEIIGLELDKKRNTKDMKRVAKNIEKLFEQGFSIEKDIALAQKAIQSDIADLTAKIYEYAKLPLTDRLVTLISSFDASLATIYQKMEFLLLNGGVDFVTLKVVTVDGLLVKLKELIQSFVAKNDPKNEVTQEKLLNLSLLSQDKKTKFDNLLETLTKDILPTDFNAQE